MPVADIFLRDQTELLEQYRWNWAVYVWRGDEPDFDGFSLEYGPDPENHATDLDNPLLAMMRNRWAQNLRYSERSPEQTEDKRSDLALRLTERSNQYTILC